jgi:ribonuclease HI
MNTGKKRAALPGTSSSGDASKKRKVDSGPKFYAVRAGFNPGVYENYADCQAQVSGFKGALFKSFTSRPDAEAYAAGRKITPAPNEPAKFYAVAVGNPTGIFTDWAEASLSIKGVKGPKYKRFDTRPDAIEYIRQFGNKETIEALGEVADLSDRPAKKAKAPARETGIKKPTEDVIQIYTDGSSRANGRRGARAGYGVYFGDGDARNISERLEGEPQTNQRAELMAILAAMEAVPLAQAIQIISDSQYSIKCVTEWGPSWKRKNWVTANNTEVKNQDIIRQLLEKVEARNQAGGLTFFQWVKGHDQSKGNIAADELAVRGAMS